MNQMNKQILFSFISGLLFAVGLNLSGMTQPQKVIGFLDILGNWNPSLIFVMVGAILVHTTYFYLIKPKFSQPLFASSYQVPSRKDITTSLILGATLFGIGWALGGYCPGPGVVSLSTISKESLIFVGAMLLGMFIYKSLENKLPFSK